MKQIKENKKLTATTLGYVQCSSKVLSDFYE